MYLQICTFPIWFIYISGLNRNHASHSRQLFRPNMAGRRASPTPPHVPNFSFLLDKPAASSCAPSLNCKLGHLFGAFKFNTSSNGTENVVPWPGRQASRLLDMYYTPTARALPTEQQQAAAQPIYASRTQIIEIKFGQTKRMCGNPG